MGQEGYQAYFLNDCLGRPQLAPDIQAQLRDWSRPSPWRFMALVLADWADAILTHLPTFD